MISVLVPVFNTDVRTLVNALSEEVSQMEESCEIIVFDDASDPAIRETNQSITSYAFLRYFQGSKNHGRVEARKKLASLAKFDWLLFLDDDSGLADAHFLRKYLLNIEGKKTVLAGGRSYSPSRPQNCAYALHWKYGSRRESGWMAKASGFHGFQTNNFLIHRSAFGQLSFPAGLTNYGHEDTWMGIELERLGYSLKQIRNAVVHLGIQTTEEFLIKSRSALDNLEMLRSHCPDKLLAAHVRLFRNYLRLKRSGLLSVVNVAYKLLQGKIAENLRSCDPQICLFDLYRLHYFMNISR